MLFTQIENLYPMCFGSEIGVTLTHILNLEAPCQLM